MTCHRAGLDWTMRGRLSNSDFRASPDANPAAMPPMTMTLVDAKNVLALESTARSWMSIMRISRAAMRSIHLNRCF